MQRAGERSVGGAGPSAAPTATPHDVTPHDVTPHDVFLGEVKSRTVFPLLILHLVREKPQYGNSLIGQIRELSGGVMSVSPNTVYPLLRRLEEKGYVVGEWERPDTRSRRFYRITPSGEVKYAEVKANMEEHLLRVKRAIESLHEEIYG